MKPFDKKEHIIRLIKDNVNGVSIDTIIDFLDYLNKVRYDKDEIKGILSELILDNKIFLKNSLYFIK